MKYKYTIFAQGEYEEEQLMAKLEEIGLQKIFVEKFSDIDAIVADQNNFIDENFNRVFPAFHHTRNLVERPGRYDYF